MASKRRKGRPALPPDAVRKFMVGCAVTAEERRRIKKAAEGRDMSVSSWLRELALDATKPKRTSDHAR